MHKISINDYQVEDFIADETFINYYFQLNEKDTLFWEEWLEKNPSKSSMVMQAKQMISMLSLSLTDNEYLEELNKIKRAINKEKPKPLFRLLTWNKLPYLMKQKNRSVKLLLFCILILSAATFYFLVQNPQNEVNRWTKRLNNTDRNIIFTLNDSTVVTLSPNSTLHYPLTFNKNLRQVYLSGEATFNVQNLGQIPFKVQSHKIITTVLGTIFTIKNMADTAIVIDLREGKLKVEIEDSTKSAFESILLTANEKAVYVFHTKHFYKKSANAEQINLTSVETIKFHQSSFEEIASHIKKVYGKTLINKSDKKSWRFTGEFRNASLEEIIENISLVKNVSSKMQADTIFILNQKH